MITYDDGEVRQEFSIVFHAQASSGQLRTSSETRRGHWVSPAEATALPMHESMRLRLERGLQDRTWPYFS
ncbi:NUDIX hydrolase [Salinifilum ghardaiensis]